MSCNFSESKSFCEVRGDRARGQERSSEVSGDRGARRVEVHLPRADDEDVLWAQSGAIGAQSERNPRLGAQSERNHLLAARANDEDVRVRVLVRRLVALEHLRRFGLVWVWVGGGLGKGRAGWGWFGFGLVEVGVSRLSSCGVGRNQT